MRKLQPRETTILIVTVSLLAVFLLNMLVIRPIHDGALNINTRLRSLSAQLGKARQMVSLKPAIEARWQHLVELIGTANSDEAQMPTIVSKIENTARQCNIHIGNIQPQKSVTQKDVIFLPVELEIDGQWLDIARFLYILQQRPNFYFIDELNLEKYSDTTNSLRGRIIISRMSLP